MRFGIIIQLIIAMAQLVQKCVCTCCSSICECIYLPETELFYCPNRTDTFVFPGLEVESRKSNIRITCSSSEMNHFSYIPNCDWSEYLMLTIVNCNVQSFVIKLLQNVKFNNLSLLELRNKNADNPIDKEAFKPLSHLKKLYLTEVRTRISNDLLFYTSKLEYLILHEVNLSDKLIYFDYVPDLINLDLSRNNINVLPNRIFRKLSLLTYLNLSSNNLTALTSEMFFGLQSVKTLDFKRNAISVIAEDTFSSLSKLTEIDLSQNQITELPKNLFTNNTKLVKLWLSDNYLTVIPDQLFLNCKNLKRLRLNSLKLEYLPEQLFSSANNSLEILELADSNLSEASIPKTFFSNLKKLKQLILSFNKLQKIDMSLFGNVSSQFSLYVSKNLIKEYPDTSKMNLNILDLSYNLITTVNVVQLMSPAKKILLENNNITKVTFWPLKNVKHQQQKPVRVNLEKNPIECDCFNYDLHLFVNKKCFGNLANAVQFEPITSRCTNGVAFANLTYMNCPIRRHCPLSCSCIFSPDKTIMQVNCASRRLEKMPIGNFFTNLTHFEWFKLYLREEFRAEFPDNCIKPEVLVSLDLSRNLIEVVDYVPANLWFLDLSGNRIRYIDVDIVQQLRQSATLLKVVLHDNPWDCGCGSFQLGQLVLFKGANSSEVYCEDRNTTLASINQPCTISDYALAAITVCLVMLFCLTAAVAIYYRFQTSIKIFLFNRDLCLCWISENDIDPDKTYDVFISFSHEDEQFVIEHLLPGLEMTKKPYKVCIHTRDWIPGDFIVEQIVRSVSESRRTLVVLSNSFVNSAWGKMEFRTAHTKAINEGKTRVIVILYGQLDVNQLDDTLKNYIQTNTYVEWGDKYFWEKLRYALPHSSLRFIESKNKILHDGLLDHKCVSEVTKLCNATKPSSVILNPNNLRQHQIRCS